jgi:hypothetical protein
MNKGSLAVSTPKLQFKRGIIDAYATDVCAKRSDAAGKTPVIWRGDCHTVQYHSRADQRSRHWFFRSFRVACNLGDVYHNQQYLRRRSRRTDLPPVAAYQSEVVGPGQVHLRVDHASRPVCIRFAPIAGDETGAFRSGWVWRRALWKSLRRPVYAGRNVRSVLSLWLPSGALRLLGGHLRHHDAFFPHCHI